MPSWVTKGAVLVHDTRQRDADGNVFAASGKGELKHGICIETVQSAESDGLVLVKLQYISEDALEAEKLVVGANPAAEATIAVTELQPKDCAKNRQVKMLSGDLNGQVGKLIGINEGTKQGKSGIVELMMRYETLPMRDLVLYGQLA